jgi:predicted nuclease of predicted toxin-antitoxin system
MARFLVDEDLPRSLAAVLRSSGQDASDVREVGLRGQSDKKVFEHAQRERLVLVTGDLEFGDETLYPPIAHHGVVVVRYPNEVRAPLLIAEIVRGIGELAGEELSGVIVVLEPGRLRMRRSAAH